MELVDPSTSPLREDFAKRYAEGVDIRLHEVLYPLLQGWDSVCINADVEMGKVVELYNGLFSTSLVAQGA